MCTYLYYGCAVVLRRNTVAKQHPYFSCHAS